MRRDAAQVVAAAANNKKAELEDERLQKLALFLEQLPRLAPAEAAEVCSDCPICLGAFTETDELASLMPCKHVFHTECIERWLLSRPHTPQRGGSSCPYCKSFLLTEDIEAAPAPAVEMVATAAAPAPAEVEVVEVAEVPTISTTAPPSPSPSPPPRSPFHELFA